MDVKDHKEYLFTEFPPVPTSVWEEKIKTDLKGAEYDKRLIWKTEEGFSVRPYYRSEDLKNPGLVSAYQSYSSVLRRSECAGGWMIRQDISEDDVEKANNTATEAIGNGADIVGFNARSITTHRQMNLLLRGIDLTKTQVYFNSSRSYPLTLELLIYELSHREAKGAKVSGGLNFDPLSYLLLHGDFYISFRNNLEEAEYLLNTGAKKLPGFRLLTVNGHYFQNAGSNLVQELAFSLASGNEYLHSLTSKGLSSDLVAQRMMFHFASGPNYFMEIAKLRAARILWAKIVEQYRPVDPASMKMFIHCSTALWNKTVFDLYVNMLRTTTEGMSAAIGNADSISIFPFSIPAGKTDGFADRIARNQQLIFREEAHLDKTVDPSAGSYYIENLTESIGRHAWELFLKIENSGGMTECIKSGFIQKETERNRRLKEEELSQRKRILIGTNQFPAPDETSGLADGLTETRVDQAGGKYETLKPFRISASFEKLRLATENFSKVANRRPQVFLYPFGNLAMQRLRAGFATNFFGCAGYRIHDHPGFESAEEGVQAVLATQPDIVVLCSSDEEYDDLVAKTAPLLKKAIPGLILVLAGYPKEKTDQYKALGVDEFIHIRSNLLESLKTFNSKIGIPVE